MWLVEVASVERQAALTSVGAVARAMAPRVAWAAADLADGGRSAWLSASERSRLRRRIRAATSVEVLQRWMASRSAGPTRYRIGESDIERLLRQDGVVATGLSASTLYGLGIGSGNSAAAYVNPQIARHLIKEFFLIESTTGNLTLRIAEHDLHLHAMRTIARTHVAPRLVVAVDLADGEDARTVRAGRDLISEVLAESRHP